MSKQLEVNHQSLLDAYFDYYKAKLSSREHFENIIKIDTPELSITYVAETSKETFDTKSFKAENPDLYDSYVKMSTVKSSLRLKVK